ncbi:MAG TPA: tetratricopeptide repeat protein, partial [Candidatus Acidoferrales bacterium]|nr:tetratricopeptide repeat protein [Candidatus Acidoferrales bacterium]
MIKSAHLYLGLAALLAMPAIVPAQDNPTTIAVNEAVLRQSKAIELQQKLADAAAAAQRNNISDAAKLYQDAVSLTKETGPIQPQTQQAIAGLTVTEMALARDAQSRQDYGEADTRVKLVLAADPKNADAIAFKGRNDDLIAKSAGHRPSNQALDTVHDTMTQKTQAATMVQDGKLFYEMGKLDEADAKLSAAVKLDPDNAGAYYYQNLVKQARYTRDLTQHSVDTQTRMEQVEKQWVLPKSSAQLPTIANPYATNNLIYTGPGRQAIVAKLDRIRLDTVNYDGLPLSEVVRQLSEQSRLRDPDRKGINFLINPNADQSGPAIAGANPGGLGGLPGGGAPAPAPIDPATGLPTTPTAATGGGEKVDIGTATTVRLALTDVRMADVLDAIVLVCEHPDGHPIKYSIQDFAVVFADKGNFEQVPLFTRVFKVDPNTFYSGLESVSSS